MVWTSRFALVAAALLTTSAWALMPPHVTGTNLRDGVLKGTTLVIRGATLSASDPKKELSIVDEKTDKPASWTHDVSCKWVGDCERGVPGSCQEQCTLTVTLEKVTDGARLKLDFLDLRTVFRVSLKPKPSP
ncbi:MAG: hypothetical protein QF464_18400 [Myxococcota bacterium]|nr:hypothetical protein [Myxococcota bacterium]